MKHVLRFLCCEDVQDGVSRVLAQAENSAWQDFSYGDKSNRKRTERRKV